MEKERVGRRRRRRRRRKRVPKPKSFIHPFQHGEREREIHIIAESIGSCGYANGFPFSLSSFFFFKFSP
jgi:hypothetical protein